MNHTRGNFIKHPSIKSKKKSLGYDLLNPCYSDSQAINKNNSAIVICSNENQGQKYEDCLSGMNTCRSNKIEAKVDFSGICCDYYTLEKR